MSENNTPKEMKFSYGGQAVIEGVMMRGAHKAAIAVRDPKGNIQVHEQPLNATLYRGRIAKTPFVRGVVGLWDALVLGTRALMWSADVALSEEEEKINFNGPLGWGTMVVALLLAVGIFFLIPTTAATGIGHALGLHTRAELAAAQAAAQQPTSADSTTPPTANNSDPAPAAPQNGLPIDFQAFLINLIEGFVQLAILIGYISLIGLMSDVKRLFGYHGAEHKTINAYEAGAELTPEVVAKYPIEHPRCGTAFLLTVVFVSVFVFSLLGRPPFLQLVLSRIVLIPVIAGIAYELLRFTARHINNPIIRLIVIPNLALQHLTTRQPELSMIEVAIVAFKRVLVSENVLSEAEAPAPQPTPAGDELMDYHFAQVNIALMRAPLHDPIMADFVANLESINAAADRAPGFVWRLQTAEGDATALRVFDNDYLLINMSVWESVDALFEYTYKSDHSSVFRRRKEWFDKLDTPTLALWWIPAGFIPTPDEAKQKLEHLQQHGATPLVFTFKQRFTLAEMLQEAAQGN